MPVLNDNGGRTAQATPIFGRTTAGWQRARADLVGPA